MTKLNEKQERFLNRLPELFRINYSDKKSTTITDYETGEIVIVFRKGDSRIFDSLFYKKAVFSVDKDENGHIYGR